MQRRRESFAKTAMALFGAAALFAGFAVSADAQSFGSRSKLQPRLISDGEPIGLRAKSQTLALQPINLDVSRFAFTAPSRVTTARPQTVERSFSFTPSGSSGRPSGVSLSMTTRSVTTPQPDKASAADAGITPAGYNFDLAVGYRGLAVTGGVSRMDSGLGGRTREGVDFGIRYGTRKWQAGIEATAERDTGFMSRGVTAQEALIGVEASGNVNLSPKVSVGGSVRYRPAPQNPTVLDPNRDDRAVMVGGAVAF